MTTTASIIFSVSIRRIEKNCRPLIFRMKCSEVCNWAYFKKILRDLEKEYPKPDYKISVVKLTTLEKVEDFNYDTII